MKFTARAIKWIGMISLVSIGVLLLKYLIKRNPLTPQILPPIQHLVFRGGLYEPKTSTPTSLATTDQNISTQLPDTTSPKTETVQLSPLPHQLTVSHANNNSPQTPDLIIWDAFLDTRPRDRHKNETIILIQLSKHILSDDLILGCGVDDHRATSHTLYSLYWRWIYTNSPNLTHEAVMLICYDLPVRMGSRAFVLYLKDRNSTEFVKESVEITFTPGVGNLTQKDIQGKVVVCTTCYGDPPWLQEWLRYQKTIGVSRVHMYVEEMFMNNTKNLRVVERYKQEGFLKVDFRKTVLNASQVYYHSQTINYNDCLYRYRDIYEYAMFIDTDDFFLPRLPGLTTIKPYLDRYFTKNIAAVTFHWYRHFPDCGLNTSVENIKDGNITDHLMVDYYATTTNFKFICKTSLTTQVIIHTPRKLMDGYQVARAVPHEKEVYVAHVRKNQKWGLPRDIKCKS